jgi:hypothetical protein
MFDSYVFPVGDEPANDRWSGFQWYHPDKQSGYLLLFREIHNKEQTRDIQLRFLKDKDIICTNIRNDQQWRQKVDEQGDASFTIEDKADFLLLKIDY